MRGAFYYYTPDSALPDVQQLDKPPNEAFIQSKVGGDFEIVPMFIRYHERLCVAFVNEHGKRLHLLPNAEATRLWRLSASKNFGTYLPDILLGPVLILTGDTEFFSEL